MYHPYPLERAHVLITGVTGLIGGELARVLAEEYSAFVSCVVRAPDESTAALRLKRRLQRGGKELSRAARARLRAVPGDVSLPQLGFPPARLRALRDSVQVIVHSAAETSFLRAESCRITNIMGMQRLIELARGCAQSPLIVYISTACNVGEVQGDCLSEEAGCRPDNAHYNEYTHSKAIAETMLKNSGLPSLILRPSIVLSAGLEDAAFARQILWIAPLFRSFEKLPINPRARLDVVPVSFVVRSALQLVAKQQRRHDCYHLSAGRDYSMEMEELMACIGAHYGARPPCGVALDRWTREDDRRYVVTDEQRKHFFAMRYYLPFLNMNVVFDNGRLRQEADVEELGLVPPTEYLPELLDQVSFAEAVRESANP